MADALHRCGSQTMDAHDIILILAGVAYYVYLIIIVYVLEDETLDQHILALVIVQMLRATGQMV